MNVVIVHGSNSSEEESKSKKWGPENLRHWKVWLKDKLEEKRISVSNELYPRDWHPNYEEWKKVFEKNKIDEDSVLIGHSAGAGFLVRWLAENKKKVNKVFLIAPYVLDLGKTNRLSNLVDFTFDESLKNYFNELIIFYAENDSDYIIESAKFVHKKLGGKLINLDGKGHLTLGDMGTKEFPELLEEVLK